MGPRLELEATGRPSQTPRLRRYARAAMTDAISRYPAPLPPAAGHASTFRYPLSNNGHMYLHYCIIRRALHLTCAPLK